MNYDMAPDQEPYLPTNALLHHSGTGSHIKLYYLTANEDRTRIGDLLAAKLATGHNSCLFQRSLRGDNKGCKCCNDQKYN